MIKSIRDDGGGVRVDLCGVITSGELLEMGDRLESRPDFTALKHVLLVFSDVEDLALNSNEIYSLVLNDRRRSELNPSLKLALVSDASLVFGLSRMYASYYSDGPWQVMVFSDFVEAEAWLKA